MPELDETQRWEVAYEVDKVPTACWADLVDWALKGYSEIEVEETGDMVPVAVPEISSGGWCAMNASSEGGFCYCGKFGPGGRELTDGRA